MQLDMPITISLLLNASHLNKYKKNFPYFKNELLIHEINNTTQTSHEVINVAKRMGILVDVY